MLEKVLLYSVYMPAPVELAPAAERVQEYLSSHFSRFDTGYDIAQGDTNTVLISHTEKPVVIKVPNTSCRRDAKDTAYFESTIVNSLHEQAVAPAPVSIPCLLNYDTRPSPYSMYSFLPGRIVSNEEIRSWTAAEKTRLGENIGAFVAWMESALSLEQYQDIRNSARYADISNRDNFLHGALLRPRYNQLEPHNRELALFFAATRRLYREQKAQGVLTPTIIGHDDLHAGNIVFDDDQTLQGVFDFGLTKPSSPERELRYAVPMGNEVIGSAITEYERQTGKRIHLPLLGFWAIVQVATTLECCLLNGLPEYIIPKDDDMSAIRKWLHVSAPSEMPTAYPDNECR